MRVDFLNKNPLGSPFLFKFLSNDSSESHYHFEFCIANVHLFSKRLLQKCHFIILINCVNNVISPPCFLSILGSFMHAPK